MCENDFFMDFEVLGRFTSTNVTASRTKWFERCERNVFVKGFNIFRETRADGIRKDNIVEHHWNLFGSCVFLTGRPVAAKRNHPSAKRTTRSWNFTLPVWNKFEETASTKKRFYHVACTWRSQYRVTFRNLKFKLIFCYSRTGSSNPHNREVTGWPFFWSRI